MVCVADAAFVGEPGGMLSNPYCIARTETVAGDPYGYSPAEWAFPAIGGASATKKTLLKVGHKAVDPPLLANDDGLLSGRIDQRPAKIIYGGLNAQGIELVKPLRTGEGFQIGETILQDERNDIRDAFLVNLFQILNETPEMTAAEVYERVAEKAAIVDPVMGRLQSEDQGPQIEREIALLAEHGRMPEMPPELIEAQGEYSIRYTSPFAKFQNSESASGYFRLKEIAINQATATGDSSALDHFNDDVAIPEIADIMAVKPSWMADEKQIEAKRGQRAEQQQQEAMIKAAPAAASVAKAAMDNRNRPAAQ